MEFVAHALHPECSRTSRFWTFFYRVTEAVVTGAKATEADRYSLPAMCTRLKLTLNLNLNIICFE